MGDCIWDPQDNLAGLSHSHGLHPSYSPRWGEPPWQGDCSWLFEFLQGLHGEEQESGVKATEVDASLCIWETKQKARTFRTLFPQQQKLYHRWQNHRTVFSRGTEVTHLWWILFFFNLYSPRWIIPIENFHSFRNTKTHINCSVTLCKN